MAKISDKQKTLLIADYHTNNFSQRELAKKYNVSVGTVSKLTKEVEPQNEHLVNAQMSILSAQERLPNEQMSAIMNTAKERAKHLKLINDNAELLADQVPMIVKAHIVEEKNEDTGEIKKSSIMDGKTLRDLVEANDKIAITLKVAERHSPKALIENSNNNNNQTIVGVSISEA